MKQGVIAETRDDQLQNKARGFGSFMRRVGYSKDQRLEAARLIYDMLGSHPDVNRELVFSAFFSYGELKSIKEKVTQP